MKQKEIVYEIVKQAGSQGIRTEQVKIQAIYKGVSDAGRYLRWLKNEKPLPKVYCERKDGDKTYTWRINTVALQSGMIAHLNSKTGIISEPKQTLTEMADQTVKVKPIPVVEPRPFNFKQLSMDFINNNPVNI